MKKLLAFLPLACMLACSNGHNNSPSNPASIQGQDPQFGVCVVALPKIALAKSSTEKFIFDLTITGPDMEPIERSWTLSGADTQAVINKIPPGEMRVFTGTLTSSTQGITHTGADTVAIIGGQTAYVNLYMRKTGNAVVTIIIEETRYPGLTGCYAFQGRIDTITFNNTILQIRSDSLSSQMFGYLMQNGQMIGKVYGPQPSFSNPVYWTISFPTAMFTLKVYGDQTAFKGMAYRSSDTTYSIGYASGFRTSCDTIVPPPPVPVTMSGCYTFEGNIDTVKLQNLVLRILSDSTSPTIYGAVTQNMDTFGLVSGPRPSVNGAPVTWQLRYFSSYPLIMKVATDGSGTAFKSIVYNPSDTVKSIGSIYGFRTSCDILVEGELKY
jgi:hypothetical protein